jgi:hypothetical protein
MIEHHWTRPLGVCVALRSGMVDTALSALLQPGVPAEGLFTPQTTPLLTVMDRLGPGANGGFHIWVAPRIPW